MKATALTLALATGLFAQSAAAQSAADEARYEALMQQADARAAEGDQAGFLRLLGEAVIAVDDAEGMHTVGHGYMSFHDVPNREAEARRFFKLAGERGHAESLAHYGEALVFGVGGDRDHEQGVTLLLKARRLGDAEAVGVLKDVAERQKQALACAVSLAERKGYKPGGATSPGDWRLVRSGSGSGRRGDTLSIYGAKENGNSERSAYDDLSVSASAFTGIETREIPGSGGNVLRYEEPTGSGGPSPQGRRDAEEILRACKR